MRGGLWGRAWPPFLLFPSWAKIKNWREARRSGNGQLAEIQHRPIGVRAGIASMMTCVLTLDIQHASLSLRFSVLCRGILLTSCEKEAVWTRRLVPSRLVPGGICTPPPPLVAVPIARQGGCGEYNIQKGEAKPPSFYIFVRHCQVRIINANLTSLQNVNLRPTPRNGAPHPNGHGRGLHDAGRMVSNSPPKSSLSIPPYQPKKKKDPHPPRLRPRPRPHPALPRHVQRHDDALCALLRRAGHDVRPGAGHGRGPGGARVPRVCAGHGAVRRGV